MIRSRRGCGHWLGGLALGLHDLVQFNLPFSQLALSFTELLEDLLLALLLAPMVHFDSLLSLLFLLLEFFINDFS